jgi:hypothetical protein
MPESPKPFVILQHILPDGSEHWDLGIDQGETLATWQLLQDPALLASGRLQAVPARRIADHRRAYLDYEGPVSGNRGQVTRVERGYCRVVDRRPDCWRVRLTGSVLIGIFEIIAVGDPSSDWVLRPAPPARSADAP